jgi:hypothetical protein
VDLGERRILIGRMGMLKKGGAANNWLFIPNPLCDQICLIRYYFVSQEKVSLI